MTDRYSQCHGDCTTDCGHCKGKGRPAPDLSPAEAAIVARFDAAPTPPEVLRERLRLDFEADLQKVLMQRVASELAGRLADAALAVFRGQQDPAVQRVLALADELLEETTVSTRLSRAFEKAGNRVGAAVSEGKAWTAGNAAARIRAAIGGDGR